MLRLKVNCLILLKEKGINQTRILKENLLGQATVQKLRKGIVPGIHEIDKLCKLLQMQPGDIIEYIED